MKIIDIYKIFFYNFGERPVEDSKLFRPLIARMKEPYRFAIKNSHGNIALDFGCGYGYGARILSEKFGVVIAADKDDSVLKNIKGNNHNVYQFCINEKLPFKNDSFDLICCFQVLEHIEKYDALLEETKRALKKSGVLMVSTPNKAKIVFGVNPYHYREFTPDELHKILTCFFPDVKLLGIFGNKKFSEFKSQETALGRRLANKVTIKIYSLLPSWIQKWLFSLGFLYGYYKLNKTNPDVWETNIDEFFYISETDISNCIDIIGVCRKK